MTAGDCPWNAGQRLDRVESELMGDPETGRPSLRIDVKTQIGATNKKINKLTGWLIGFTTSVLLLVIEEVVRGGLSK